MFLTCFWIVVSCLLVLTVGQIRIVAEKRGALQSQWQSLGAPGLMYFLSGAWLFGGRYAAALIRFDLPRDPTLGKTLRATASLMSVAFITMLVAWLAGLISLIPK